MVFPHYSQKILIRRVCQWLSVYRYRSDMFSSSSISEWYSFGYSDQHQTIFLTVFSETYWTRLCGCTILFGHKMIGQIITRVWKYILFRYFHHVTEPKMIVFFQECYVLAPQDFLIDQLFFQLCPFLRIPQGVPEFSALLERKSDRIVSAGNLLVPLNYHFLFYDISLISHFFSNQVIIVSSGAIYDCLSSCTVWEEVWSSKIHPNLVFTAQGVPFLYPGNKISL